MSISTSEQTVFHLDREHRAVRYTVVLILLLSFVLVFAVARYVLSALFPEINSTVILSCLAAVPLSLLFSALGEWFLKRYWHSGRTLAVDSQRITLHLPEQNDKEIDRSKHVNALWWQIPLAGYARGGRERRIPAKWYCVAGQLQQDETRIVVYSYASPQRRRRWLESYDLEKLGPDDVYNTSFSARIGSPRRPEIPADVIAGRQGRFWLAERNRWRDGVELNEEDFEQFLELWRSHEA